MFPQRPLNNENDRAETLAALECVDYVTIFEEDNPIAFLQAVKPSVHVKGADYQLDKIIEKKTVEDNNGQIELIPITESYSTSELIKKIIRLYK